ncbi:hypothetical protein CBS147339_2372 [Penicillium roqueforti]|uniref:Heat shock protein 9/12 n=1 Tax=Penicillium roqueforti (strain FM164) TaxID=1365484 RepID=W6QLR9_PENRF|nr:hypothetical protein CBS147339_2372 [Penicillium roqueforti]KAI3090241.1 hypothetical protein CBS147338_9163 [Penicillium roqueforti]KAI3187276.1 hypothetical protein DTO032C6_4054 [Penicillium roqueforti]CDM36936.1 Heat shock protein 9/12 [Penicillium roqueforti FM164]
MSDTGRNDLTTKAKKEPIPDPDQDKSKKDIIPDPNQDKSKESVTDTTERATRGLKTDDSKGINQDGVGKIQRVSDNHGRSGATGSAGDKAKGALGLGGN